MGHSKTLGLCSQEAMCGAQKDDPWTVRVLPKVYFGVHPLGLDGVSPDDPDIVVLHHFLGSWKVRGGWSGGFGIGQLLRRAASFFSRSAAPEPCGPILHLLPELQGHMWICGRAYTAGHVSLCILPSLARRLVLVMLSASGQRHGHVFAGGVVHLGLSALHWSLVVPWPGVQTS